MSAMKWQLLLEQGSGTRFLERFGPLCNATIAVATCRISSCSVAEEPMFQSIFGNYLLLSGIILLILFMVPALFLRGRGLRESHGADRRKAQRNGIDRRA